MREGRGLRVTGCVQVKGKPDSLRWHALWRDADGRHQRVLGLADVRDSGRRTVRGGVIWRTGDGRKSAGALTPAEAEDELRRILEHEARRTPRAEPSGSAVTFERAAEEWLRYVEHDRKRRPSTVRDYRNLLRADLIPEFAAEPISEIDDERIERYRARLVAEGRLSDRTINKLLVVLHGIFKRAMKVHRLASNPAATVDRQPLRRSGDFDVLSPAEVEAVARAASSVLDSSLFRVAAFTGLRMGELLALRWQDVDFGRRLVHVRRSYARGEFDAPKSGRVRSVPMIDQVVAALDELSRRERFTGPGDLVFCGEVGDPVESSGLRRRFYAALERVGLKRIRFHDLRHTFGTLAVQVFPLSDVKAYMGHADISTTMIYVHHVPRHDAAERLSAAVRAETEPMLGSGVLA